MDAFRELCFLVVGRQRRCKIHLLSVFNTCPNSILPPRKHTKVGQHAAAKMRCADLEYVYI